MVFKFAEVVNVAGSPLWDTLSVLGGAASTDSVVFESVELWSGWIVSGVDRGLGVEMFVDGGGCSEGAVLDCSLLIRCSSFKAACLALSWMDWSCAAASLCDSTFSAPTLQTNQQ